MKANIKPITPDRVTVLECFEEDCIFKHECANHVTAGDFRTEDGLVPDISLVEGVYHCSRDPVCTMRGAVLSDFTYGNEQ